MCTYSVADRLGGSRLRKRCQEMKIIMVFLLYFLSSALTFFYNLFMLFGD